MSRYIIVAGVSLFIFATNLSSQTGNGFSTRIISSQWNQAVGLTFNSAGTKMFVWERGEKFGW